MNFWLSLERSAFFFSTRTSVIKKKKSAPIHNMALQSECSCNVNLIHLLAWEKTSSAHFSCLSAVHNHETACGILQLSTLMLNSDEEVRLKRKPNSFWAIQQLPHQSDIQIALLFLYWKHCVALALYAPAISLSSYLYDARRLHSRLPWSHYLQKASYTTPCAHTYTQKHQHVHNIQHLGKNIYPTIPHSSPKIATHSKWRLQCHSYCNATEITCIFPLLVPDLARSNQEPSAL